jgi:hypothetical protein
MQYNMNMLINAKIQALLKFSDFYFTVKHGV